jgi:GNAT superfamily N-acetyltransferase
MNFIIRQAKVSDAGAISQLVTEWACRDFEDPASPEAIAYLDTLTPAATALYISALDFNYYVAQNCVGLCGVIALRDSGRIHKFFVSSDMQGKGVARALWEHAKAHASRSTFIVNSSLRAVPVYSRFGFVAKAGRQKTKYGIEVIPMEYAP